MGNKYRLLSNIMNNNRECKKVFESISKLNKTHPTLLPASTPIPNQAFANEENYFDKNATIHFTQNAMDCINYLRDVDHYITSRLMSQGKQPQPLKFSCFGYKDLDGDIVIQNVCCPVIQEAEDQNFTKKSQMFDYIMQNMTKKSLNIDNASLIFDFLRQHDFNKKMPIGTAMVALLGTTKHASLENDTYNCMTLSELSEAVMPYYTPITTNNIMSGVIAITPKTISEKYLVARHKKEDISKYLQDGSLEIALISYEKSKSTGYVTPVNITNVASAKAETKDGSIIPIKVSSSYQPIQKIYKANQPKHDYSM